MTPSERYARNFAKVAYHEDNLDCLYDIDRYQIARIFDTFKPEYHAAIAEYPFWILQDKNMTPRDRRRAAQYAREDNGKDCRFLFSHARIVRYLEQLQNSQS
jgi:hypothetical protein